MYIFTYISQYRDAGRTKVIKNNWDGSNCRVLREASRVPYVHQPLTKLLPIFISVDNIEFSFGRLGRIIDE